VNKNKNFIDGGEILDKAIIAEKLKTLRNNRSAQEVADACGISKSALAMYETAERIPRDEIKVKLARFYGTTVEAIFFSV